MSVSRGAEKWLNKEVRAYLASNRESTHAIGRVVSYTDMPTVTIQTPDGEQTHWHAHLCEYHGKDAEIEKLERVKEAAIACLDSASISDLALHNALERAVREAGAR